MLEAYNARTPLRSCYQQCFVFNISSNLGEVRAVFKTLSIPDTHTFIAVMEHFSRAFGKILEGL